MRIAILLGILVVAVAGRASQLTVRELDGNSGSDQKGDQQKAAVVIISKMPSYETGRYALSEIALLDNDEAWAVGYDGVHTDRLYHSRDKGKTWAPVDVPGSGSTMKSLAFADSQHGWVVGSGGVILRTANGGKAWEVLKPPTRTDLHAVYFANSKVGYVAGRDGLLNRITNEVNGRLEILCTKNGGDSWRRCYSENEYRSVFQITASSESAAFVAVGGNRLIRTENMGDTWEEIKTPASGIASVTIGPNGVLWIVGLSGEFLQSSDGGRTWKKSGPVTIGPRNAHWWQIAFNDAGTGIAIGESGVIAATLDNGTTWQLQQQLIPDNLRGVSVKGGNAIIVGADNVYTVKIAPLMDQ